MGFDDFVSFVALVLVKNTDLRESGTTVSMVYTPLRIRGFLKRFCGRYIKTYTFNTDLMLCDRNGAGKE